MIPSIASADTQPLRYGPARNRGVLAVTSVGVFVVFLDATIVNVAFEAMSRDLGASPAGLSWVLNAYSLVFAALLVPAGRLADQIGRRRLFLVGLVGFAVASLSCGLAPDIETLIVARGVQAVFAALLVPSSLALLLADVPAAARATAVGTWGAMGAVAAASGPTLGALLVDHASWRWVFLINLPICLAAVAVGRRRLRESRDPAATGVPDPVGIVLVAAVPGLLSLAIVQGPTWGWTDPRICAAFLGAAVGVPLFLARLRRAERPIIDPEMLRSPSFFWANIGTLLFASAFFGVTLANIIFLQRVWGWSPLTSALAVTPSPILAAVCAPLGGRYADRHGYRAVVACGALVVALGMFLFATRVGAHPDYPGRWLPASALVGAGIGLTLPALASAAAAELAPRQFGTGSAVNAAFRQLGAVLGVSLFVAVVGTPTSLGTALDAFDHVWLLFGGLAILVAAVSLALRPAGPAVAGGAGGGTAVEDFGLPPLPPLRPLEPLRPLGPLGPLGPLVPWPDSGVDYPGRRPDRPLGVGDHTLALRWAPPPGPDPVWAPPSPASLEDGCDRSASG